MINPTDVLKGKAPVVTNANHIAYRCFDAEETRVFYEDILGLKLAAALDLEEMSGVGTPLVYMHLFFEMADGNFIAFFDIPDLLRPNLFKRKNPLTQHIAIEVANKGDMEEVRARLDACGYETFGPFDHGFVDSICAYDPNGLLVEITYKMDAFDAVMKAKGAEAHAVVANWTKKTKTQKDAFLAEQENNDSA